MIDELDPDIRALLERNGRREEAEAGGARTLPAARLASRPVEWIWRPYVPAGMLTLLAGRPGEGKSTAAVDVAARVSRAGRAVLIISAEDDPERIIRPRLEVARADLDRVFVWRADLPELPDGVEAIAEEARQLGVALVVLDPLNAFIALAVNSHRDHHVRRVLAPLGHLAEETGAAVLVVGHLNKGAGEDPLARVGGSVAYVAAARQVLVAAPDPADDGRRVLAAVKSNVAELAPALAYGVEGVELPGGIRTSRVVWLGEAPEVDVRALLAPPAREERTLALEVAEVLRQILADGPRPAREVKREVREAVGDVSEGLIAKARRAAGVEARKSGFEGSWEWYLAEDSHEDSRPTPWERESSARPAETATPAPEDSRPRERESSAVVPPEVEGAEREALGLVMAALGARVAPDAPGADEEEEEL